MNPTFVPTYHAFVLTKGWCSNAWPNSHKEEPRATCAPGTQLTLLPPETGAYPQDQFRANLYDVVDTESSAPTAVVGKSALLTTTH